MLQLVVRIVRPRSLFRTALHTLLMMTAESMLSKRTGTVAKITATLFQKCKDVLLYNDGSPASCQAASHVLKAA